MSRARVELYYDYRSPYAYLAVERAYALAARYNAELVWKPIRLPELSSYRERPLNSSYPKKMAYLRVDLQRWADRSGVPLTFPRGLQPPSGSVAGVVVGKQHPLDTDAALRGALVAQARGVFDMYHRAVFRALWGEGRNIAQLSVLQALLEEIGPLAITVFYCLALAMSGVWAISATITAEIFPTHMRATANAVANNVLGRLGCVLSPSLIGLLSSPLGSVGNAATVVVWGNVLICVPILLLLLPETRGKTLEEIAARTPATGGNNKDRRDE